MKDEFDREITPPDETTNPHGLELNKKYWFKYKHTSGSEWYLAKVTRFTVNGHPWIEGRNGRVVSGIVSPGSYLVRNIKDNAELHELAQKHLDDKWIDNPLIDKYHLIELMVEFYESIQPKE